MTLLGLLFYVLCTNDDKEVLRKGALDDEHVVFTDFVIYSYNSFYYRYFLFILCFYVML